MPALGPGPKALRVAAGAVALRLRLRVAGPIVPAPAHSLPPRPLWPQQLHWPLRRRLPGRAGAA